MATVIFIDEQYLKDTSALDENVDIKLLRNVIKEAQDIHITPLLGTSLYNELITQISAGTVTALNRTLLDSYISPCLKNWVMYEGIDVLTFKFMNKSVMKRSSDNAQPIETNDVIRLMSSFRNKAEHYQERAYKYLLENETSYPLYLNQTVDGYDTIYPHTRNFTQGWNLSDKGSIKGIDIDKGRENYC